MYSNSFRKVYINKVGPGAYKLLVGPTGQNYSYEKELTHVTGGLAHTASKEKWCWTGVTTPLLESIVAISLRFQLCSTCYIYK